MGQSACVVDCDEDVLQHWDQAQYDCKVGVGDGCDHPLARGDGGRGEGRQLKGQELLVQDRTFRLGTHKQSNLKHCLSSVYREFHTLRVSQDVLN